METFKRGRKKPPSPAKAEMRAYSDKQKRLRGVCVDCQIPVGDRKGEYPPYCYDWDHRDGTTKFCEVSRMLNVECHYTLAQLEAEILKCDLRCARYVEVRDPPSCSYS